MLLLIKGVVQGVGFRPSVFRVAKSLNLRGYVLNKGSYVEVCINKNHKEFLKKLMKEIPPLARIDEVKVKQGKCNYKDFFIINSEKGERGDAIPPDIALCKECLKEIFDKKNRRFLYPFTNCTNCGERFSVIYDVPYDRENTSMKEFFLCNECLKEYKDPKDRRFHAQTISCRKEGLKYVFYDKNVKFTKNYAKTNMKLFAKGIEDKKISSKFSAMLNNKSSIKSFAEQIDNGKIGVMKSWGGMHIVCKIEKVKELREWYKRPEKPFAVMFKDMKTAEKYCILNEEDKKLLNSSEKPIVLVQKRFTPFQKEKEMKFLSKSFNEDEIRNEKKKKAVLKNFRKIENEIENTFSEKEIEKLTEIFECISPSLESVGIYLPYTPAQHILFYFLKSDAIIMTSANLPGEPMIIENEKAFSLNLDCYLLHNRKIVNRIDDSVLIPFENKTFFIRKSRGFIPSFFNVDYKESIISVGAELNVNVSLSKNKKLYTTQYIGNSNKYHVLEFLNNAVEHFMKLLDIKKVDGIGIDIHPRYNTRNFALGLGKKFNAKIFEVQHHFAHAISLMKDNEKEEIIALTLDGAGYGTDGKIWGGEVLKCNYENFERVGSLEYIPLIGGDKAVFEPKRIIFATQNLLGKESSYYDKKTKEVFAKLIKKSPLTSSFGRVLDGVSCYLNICQKQTYDGEPAMKLERYLQYGKDTYEFETEVVNVKNEKNSYRKVIRTLPLFSQLFEYTKKPSELSNKQKCNLAFSFVKCLIEEICEIAIEDAKNNSIKNIGITGGVSYNLPIVRIAKNYVEKNGFNFLMHSRIPNGDGGISIGQNLVVGEMVG